MGRGRPAAAVSLRDSDRSELTAWCRRRKTAQALALRARIILDCADGLNNRTVPARHHVTQQTVSKWRGRFSRLGLDDLTDAPRVGAPRSIDDATIEAVIARTLESKPKGATHWSSR